MFDLEPATSALADLVGGVSDDQLSAPTPNQDTTVGDLLDHVSGLAEAFAAAADKSTSDTGGRPATPNASNLGPDWRTQIPDRLSALGQAWRATSAWEGTTTIGGNDMPADMVGVIALDEVIIHGWDIAKGSGQAYSAPLDLVEAAYGFVESTVAQNPDGTPGLFGPPVPVADDAPLLDRLIGLSGRDPHWES
jgi:uncharacterized protein (TIGR03086 family)